MVNIQGKQPAMSKRLFPIKIGLLPFALLWATNEACEAANLVGKGKTLFTPVEPVMAYNQAHLEQDFCLVSLAEKQKLLGDYHSIVMRFRPNIQTTATGYGDSFG